jgi:hypothetical protein
LFSLKSVQKVILDQWQDPVKAESVARAYERTCTTTVRTDQGNPEVPYKFDLPKWHEMGEGICSIPAGRNMEDPVSHVRGGFQPDRNPTFKKFCTRAMRPVVNFDTFASSALCAGGIVLTPTST